MYISLSDVESAEPIPDYSGRFLHSENMTVAHWSVESGAPFPEHSHPHEQFSIVTEGEFELTIEGETEILRPGVVAIIPSNAKHSGRALTRCQIIDVFHPVRDEYR